MVSFNTVVHVPFHICGQGTSQVDSTGVVDKNVNSTKLLHSLFNSFGYLILIPYVHNARQAFTSSLLHYQIEYTFLLCRHFQRYYMIPSFAAVQIVPGSLGWGSAVFAAITILAPSWAALRAIALPIPLLAPVINIVRPARALQCKRQQLEMIPLVKYQLVQLMLNRKYASTYNMQ